MKNKTIRNISLIMMIIISVISCEMFTNDPGKKIPVNENTDVAITNVNAPTAAFIGENITVSLTVENLGIEDVDRDITFSFSDQENGSEIDSYTYTGGIVADSSVNIEHRWEVNGNTGAREIHISHDYADPNEENNSAVLSFSVNEAPMEDIAITIMDAPSSANQRSTVDIIIFVENTGSGNAEGSIEVTLRDETDDYTIASQNINDGLDAGESSEIIFSWSVDDSTPGDHTLGAYHDYLDGSNSNNSDTAIVSVSEQSTADIAVIEFTGPSEATEGDDIDFSMELMNVSNIPFDGEFDFTVTDETDDTEIHFRTINEEIEAGGVRTYRIGWETDDASIGEHTITASHTNEDDNLDNNSRSTTITINQRSILRIKSVKPDEVEQDEKKKVTVKGEGFRKGLDIEFIKRSIWDSWYVPSISDIDVKDEKTIQFTVKTKDDGPDRDIEWDLQITNPDGNKVVKKKAFKVEDD